MASASSTRRVVWTATLALCVLGSGGLQVSFIEGILRLYRLQSESVRNFPQEPLEEYDFVVVGSGPGGSVVGHRLSEDPSSSVLLLEAGPPDNVIVETPAFNPYLVLTDFSWAFNAERQEGACLGFEEETCPWPSGRGAGGGSGMNAMIYTRGNYKDFDSWAAQGNPGWSYEEVLPYFKKSERVTIKELEGSPYHGTRGNLSVGYVPYTTPLLKAFLKAGVESGYKLTDYNAPRSHIGFSQIQATVKGGRRASAVSSFIKPILGIRPNFHFFLRAQATKVLVDPATMTAYGVEYIRNGVKRVVKARKEVILSAGAFNTPQLLMLSGIGHKDHLESLGIPCLVDLPVGDGLMEHIGMNGLVFLLDQNVGIRTVAVTRAVPQLMAEATRGRGPLTSLGCEGIAFVQTKYANRTDDVPDIELLFVPAGINNDGGNALRKTMDITDSLYNTVYGPVNYRDSFTIWPILLYPKSKGYVRLRNKVPTSKVRIYANFLTEREDVLTMVEGIKAAVRLAESAAFKKYGARLHKTPIPECEELGFGTDPYWECSVRYITSQFHHQCCTAPMGPVLDPRLRVRGVAHLRVADASVMPSIPGAHTQAPAYMIGEKAADLIKQDWQMPLY